MPSQGRHRGADPRDADAFGPTRLPALRAALSDLCWLLTRDYAPVSALKLVGDRWNLTERQRMAVRRSACSDADRRRRRASLLTAAELAGGELWIDGFNVLTTIESSLGGGVVIHCRDGTFRDIAGVHGTYRKVVETSPALERLAARIANTRVGAVRWLFDRPVSNSGRIRSLVLEIARTRSLEWTVDLVNNPDVLLKPATVPIATADGAILDAGPRWFNLARDVIESTVGGERGLDLSGE